MSKVDGSDGGRGIAVFIQITSRYRTKKQVVFRRTEIETQEIAAIIGIIDIFNVVFDW